MITYKIKPAPSYNMCAGKIYQNNYFNSRYCRECPAY